MTGGDGSPTLPLATYDGVTQFKESTDDKGHMHTEPFQRRNGHY